MSPETFYTRTYTVLQRLLDEAPGSDRDALVAAYADLLTRLHAADTHDMLNQVLEDARLRLDARLSPDPVSQGLANVQVTVQDLWQTLWRE